MYAALVAAAISIAPTPQPSSPASAVTAAAVDVARMEVALIKSGFKPKQIKEELRFYRYLWFNSKAEHYEDDNVVNVFDLNLKSDQGVFGYLTIVSPNLGRIDLRDFGWDKRLLVWEKFRDIDYIFHVKIQFLEDTVIEEVWPGGEYKGKDYEYGVYNKTHAKKGQIISAPAPWLPEKEITYLRKTLITEVPIVSAHWRFVQTARQISIRNKDEGVGYYEWLGIKKRQDFFDLAGVNEDRAIKRFREWRAVVERSGISQQGRQIVRLGGDDAVWGTLDVFSQVGRGQPKKNLERGQFLHDAEEWYGFLPNGLMLTLLANAQGLAQATAPDQIGPDDSTLRVGKDARVHANLSCIRCHGSDKEMLKPINDWVRKIFRAGGPLELADKKKDVIQRLKNQYLRDLDKLLARDRQRYTEAIAEVTTTKANPKGKTSTEIAKLYGEYWNRYVEEPVTVEVAARELGTWSWKLKDAIRKHMKTRGVTDLILAAFVDEPSGSITRLEWEEVYGFTQTLIHGLTALPEIEKKEEAKPD